MNTKEKLLISAKKIFSEKGYHDTKVSDIVEDAGVAQGTFYIYFKSKEDIFKELIFSINEKIFKEIENCCNAEEDAENILKNIVNKIANCIYENKEIASIFLFQMICLNEDFKKIYIQKMLKLKDYILQIVKKGINQKKFRYNNEEVIANIIIGSIRQNFLELILTDNKTKEEFGNLLEESLNIVLKGIK
ncbi:transcriptional regulator, TetR family [Venenivibrio stagnispumantis]|uniref:Transcriptional regulator, TetR family n=1 Tax=Venenivibrio stagnispumantis TaxID=407998 RepID=A0AA45WJT3_9AQUI|nr:TetR/AcrR family transcriptional regulator [Venenivibrio stagnispumantis]MCW4572918.1 TetR/AcrR family transcriptional regulator [Venenivibrio stagnispumantis]SMP04543.1 transcriptional regulator, TetR family [Venenivibrio stagnispumantis]